MRHAMTRSRMGAHAGSFAGHVCGLAAARRHSKGPRAFNPDLFKGDTKCNSARKGLSCCYTVSSNQFPRQ